MWLDWMRWKLTRYIRDATGGFYDKEIAAFVNAVPPRPNSPFPLLRKRSTNPVLSAARG